MDNKTKVKLEDLMARAEQRRDAQPKVKTFYSKELGGEITLTKMPLTKYLEMTDEIENTESAVENLEYTKKTIYMHCKLLQDKRLQEAYGCAEPYDIVTKVFDENLGEMTDIVTVISSMYGVDIDVNSLKN